MNKLPFQVGPYDKVASWYCGRSWKFCINAQKPTIYNTIFDLLQLTNQERIVPNGWYVLIGPNGRTKFDCCYSKKLLRWWKIEIGSTHSFIQQV